MTKELLILFILGGLLHAVATFVNLSPGWKKILRIFGSLLIALPLLLVFYFLFLILTA